MKIIMRGNRVGVELLGSKASKGFLAMPEDNNSTGRIKYVGDDVKDLKVGMQVYFGNQRQQIKMNGQDVLVMNEENIYAIAEDNNEQSKPEKIQKQD